MTKMYLESGCKLHGSSGMMKNVTSALDVN